MSETTYTVEEDLEVIYTGDTFLGHQFTVLDAVGDPVSIVGAVIELKTKTEYGLTTVDSGGITITNGAAGVFQLDEQIINWSPRIYEYTIRITFADGTKRTYVKGNWEIKSR